MKLSPKIALALAVVAAVPSTAGAQSTEPSYPSPEWFQRERANYQITTQEPAAQASDPAFMQAWQARSATNILDYAQRSYVQRNWPWDSRGNLCAYWAEQCTGDPQDYPDVDPFYEVEGEVTPVIYADSEGALLSGRVWAPRDVPEGTKLPAVVIETGSVQVSETAYWWFAQELVRNGYVVMTYDVRGQGRSDNRTPDNEPGTNLQSGVFVTNLVDSIDFFFSSPENPYPHNTLRPASPTTAHNPIWELVDRDRLGIVGHSLGATGVSVVQGITEWPGALTETNPVDVAVAWDNLSGSGSLAGFEVEPRVPTMGQSADYGLVPTPFTQPPDADGKKGGFEAWKAADVPVYQVNIQGGTHYEWSYIPSFPSSSWDDWGNPLVEHYSVAWLDRWLKNADEPGYATADDRLLDDEAFRDRMSFYYDSARYFPTRAETWADCEDIKSGC